MNDRVLRSGCIVVVAAVGATACTSQPRTTSPNPTHQGAARASLIPVGEPPSGRWTRYLAKEGGRGVDVYVAHSEQPKPVVVLLHGSGCAPEFTRESDKSLHETSIFQDGIGPALDRVHVAVVEKRGVEPLAFAAGMSKEDKQLAFEQAERQCSVEYVQHVTKSERVADAVTAIRALREQAWSRAILLVGHSEGTHVATGVLRNLTDGIVDVAGLFASAGPIPFFGGYVARGPGDRELFTRTFERIRMLQGANDDFVYQGLPARRWKTFWLDSTPIEDVRDSTVPLFVSQGTRDDTTLPADLFTLEAIRQQPGRPIRYLVVEQGDHAFAMPDGRWRVDAVFADFLSWALDPKRQTSLDVLK